MTQNTSILRYYGAYWHWYLYKYNINLKRFRKNAVWTNNMFADNKFSNPIKKQLVNSAASDVITLSYLDKFFYQHSKLK